MGSEIGQGAATGAAAGAAAGTSVLPGWGTAIGAGVGAIAGGIQGYGVGQRRKHQQEAEAQYEAHLRSYLAQNAIDAQQLGKNEFNTGQQQLAQTGNLGQAYGATQANVAHGAEATGQRFAAIPNQPNPVGQVGSAWDTGQQSKDVMRNQQASQAFMAPQTQAYQFHGGQVAAGLQQQQAQNQYQLQGAMSGQDLRQMQQMYAMRQGGRDLAFQQQYGQDAVNAYHAANAGSEAMLYGQLLQTGAQMGAGAYGMRNNRMA